MKRLYFTRLLSVEIPVGLPTRNRLWDYTDAYNWRGVIRWDYFPMWAGLGLLLEPVRRMVDAALGS